MEIQDAKQARPHNELIAKLLDSRQPKTEREHAAAREIERLRTDLETAERALGAQTDFRAEIERLYAQVAALQARVDALMLEFCPDEMTKAQLENWARHQRPASDEDRAAAGGKPRCEATSA